VLKEEEQLRVILNAYLADVVEERGEYGEFQAAIVGDPSLVIAYLLAQLPQFEGKILNSASKTKKVFTTTGSFSSRR